MEIVSCNLCRSTNYTLLYQIPDLLMDKKDELFSLVKCDHCGLIYQNPRPTQREIEHYYPQEYEPYYQERSENWIVKKVNRYGIEKRCRIINSLPGIKKGGNLLDIGCSTGLFLNELQQTGIWKVSGIEPNEFAAHIARERFKLKVFIGSLSETNYPTGFFDVVTLWDVLEHLPDPADTLNEISRITKPQGYLVMRIPNYDSLDSILFGSAWAGLDLPRHYYVFSRQNIRQFIEKKDFVIKKISGGIGTYPTFTLSIRFWLTIHSIDSSIRKKIIGILNHPLVKLLSAPFFYFYGLFRLGSEITVIAKKLG
jgi:2-polyprenyl-3-methyl-5-hydroxy-6-metoxy-1,4-benzoquinol methylase